MARKFARKDSNKTTNKRLIWLISIILVVSVLGSGTLFAVFYYDNYGVNPTLSESAKAKNVILLIGDGMGQNHIKAGEMYAGQLTMTKFPVTGTVTTRSLSISVTDSAAAATAMATGTKVFNGNLSYLNGKELTNLGQLVKSSNKRLGIIATKSVTDATPAAFTSHAKNRSMQEDIAYEQITRADCDILFGLGKEYFDPYANLIDTGDRAYVNDFDSLDDCDADKIYAIFEDAIATSGTDTLAYLTNKALSKLDDNNENGFFLMVEGSKIDSASHGNDMQDMLNQLTAFDAAVQVAYSYAAINRNTTVIVVADHETGKLELPASGKAEDLTNECFHSGGHTSRDIRYFATGVGAKEIPSKIDNTDIFDVITQLLGIAA